MCLYIYTLWRCKSVCFGRNLFIWAKPKPNTQDKAFLSSPLSEKGGLKSDWKLLPGKDRKHVKVNGLFCLTNPVTNTPTKLWTFNYRIVLGDEGVKTLEWYFRKNLWNKLMKAFRFEDNGSLISQQDCLISCLHAQHQCSGIACPPPHSHLRGAAANLKFYSDLHRWCREAFYSPSAPPSPHCYCTMEVISW